MRRIISRRFHIAFVVFVCAVGVEAQAPGRGGSASITAASLTEWLTFIASDELQGREVYSEGLGLAASYIADHLKEWGVRPAAEDGGYYQTVKIVSVRTTSRSSVTVKVHGESRTFDDGEGISLPRNMGGRQTLRGSEIQFVGYGLQSPAAGIDDYAGTDVTDSVVVWLGSSAPKRAARGVGRLLAGRARLAVEKGAIATIGPPLASARSRGKGARGQAAENGAQPAYDFTTTQRYDLPTPPEVTAHDEFFEFLFSGSKVSYAELKEAAARGEALPRFALEDVEITFEIAPEYTIAATRLTRNVVGIIEGTDPALKNTYVAFGAHYDHIGYEQNPAAASGGTPNPGGCTGQIAREPRPGDLINNGADDDGSGTVALMAIARAFARGERPKRSLVFVWHSAEETGLQGSRYNADHPVVPNESIVAQLNVDMIGRNRCDDPAEANTVYLIGSDRISTDLHNISEDANAAMPRPLTLDYELNDPADPQSLYTRSDHYSYAAKGIPVIFYTTGLHRDYHAVTDEIERIEFAKLTRVTQLIYSTGARLANLERAPERDNRGPRAGRQRGGKIR